MKSIDGKDDSGRLLLRAGIAPESKERPGCGARRCSRTEARNETVASDDEVQSLTAVEMKRGRNFPPFGGGMVTDARTRGALVLPPDANQKSRRSAGSDRIATAERRPHRDGTNRPPGTIPADA
jgi:hypothetical protein